MLPKTRLRELVALAASAARARSPLGWYQRMLFHQDSGNLTIAGGSDSSTTWASIPHDSLEDYRVSVLTSDMLQLSGAIEGETTIELSGSKLLFRSSGADYRMAYSDTAPVMPSGWPTLPKPPEEPLFTVRADDLRRCILDCCPAMSDIETRGISLNALHMTCTGTSLEVVASDSRVLACRQADCEGKPGRVSVADASLKALRSLLLYLPPAARIRVAELGGCVYIWTDEAGAKLSVPAGRAPSFANVLAQFDSEAVATASPDKAEFHRALSACTIGVHAKDSDDVLIVAQSGGLTIMSKPDHENKMMHPIACECSVDEPQVMVFSADFLRRITTPIESVELRFLLIEGQKGERGYTAMVGPCDGFRAIATGLAIQTAHLTAGEQVICEASH